ncbi:hypothetical protein ETW23_07640 [Leisingera sp. NJS201]|uniref:hypothetical protein n=1 Tax=Leisingera sp. NJS201 TaxID=2508306 RepID=UPI0010714CD1|nr:hypothetical protein [Leisingera sp. NJS201]QBR36032.1 hypothetical protein ETW23_07640 [Leisingera sp. NJS201]
MFNIIERPTFTRTVKVRVPKDDGVDEQDFKATFNAMDDDALNGLGMADVEGTKEFLRQAVASLDDLAGADGKPIPYNDEIRETVFKLPYARIALMAAYHNGMNGLLPGN